MIQANSTPGEKFVGIDIGTTNSLIAIATDHTIEGVQILAKAPSIIHYSKEGIKFGIDAEQQTKSFRSIKRLIGKGIDNLAEINSSYDINLKTSNNYVLKLHAANGKEYTPLEITAEMLSILKDNAEKTLGHTITKAVITVPAHFDEAARIATRDAARIAGIEVLRLLNEPTAAAVAYGLHRGKNGYFLIYDLGGGTFDISIMKMSEGVLRVIATGGDSNLGGDDFDIALMSYLYQQYDIDIDQITGRTLKEKLSIDKQISIVHQDKSAIIIEDEINSVWEPLIKETIRIINKTLLDAGMNLAEFDDVILVGGATKVAYVKEMLQNILNDTQSKAKILSTISPDDVVAIGAAIQARTLQNGSGQLLLDIVPLSLGIEVMGDVVEVIIPRNTPIPAIVTKSFGLQHSKHKNIKIHILQGEGKKVIECRSLGQFILKYKQNENDDSTNQKKHIDVQFCIDADGILTVSAIANNSSASCEMTVKPAHGLTEENILKLIVARQKQPT